MRIAIYRPGVIANGTAFEAMALIYKYLQRKYGWEFTVIKDEEDPFEDKNLKVINVPKKSRKTMPFTPLPLKPFGFRRDVVKVLKGYDIILSVDPTIYSQGIHAAYAAKKWSIPLVVDASLTTMGAGYSLFWKGHKKFASWALKQSSLIWIPTPKTAERFRDLGYRDESILSRLIVLGHPVDTELFKINNSVTTERKTIICVARLVLEKGIQYIIEAVAPVIREDKEVKLRIVGSGPAKNFLTRLIEDEGISNNVEFTDPVSHSNVASLYQSSGLFIGHPISISDWEEFFGVVNIEAMACGLPIITTRCGGITYLAREDIASFVEERDIVATTEAIKGLLYSDELYMTRSQNGIEYVNRKYSVNVIGEKYRKYVLNLIESQAHGS
nr:glycosyltransferase [Cohnella hashimotonis]